MALKINKLFMSLKYRGVEQLVARRAHNPKVVGSNPASATMFTKRLAEKAKRFLFLKLKCDVY